MVLLEQRNPIVENKPDGGEAGIQNWKDAWHVERAWVNKKRQETKQLVAPTTAA